MADFATVHARLLARYQAARHTAGSVELVFRFRHRHPEGVIDQRVRVAWARALGRDWLQLTAPLLLPAEITADELLRHNLTLAVGAVGGDAAQRVLRQLVPLAPLDDEVLDLTLQALAHEAARLRSGGAVADPARDDLFAAYET